MNSSHKNKFNINISLNKNIIFNNNNHLFFISPTLSLQNIKHFLELYKTSEKNSIFSEKFINECPLYTKESQLPDSFYKLKKPFDRNGIFYIPHGPYGYSNRKNHYSFKFKNYYPSYPLILSSSCELISKLNKKNKSGGYKANEHKINKKVDIGEKDFMMNNLSNKIWTLEIFNDNLICKYGPYSSKVLLQFLKNYYIPLNDQEKKKMNLLITDILCDIYYQPESLYQILQVQFNYN